MVPDWHLVVQIQSLMLIAQVGEFGLPGLEWELHSGPCDVILDL